MRCLYCGEPLSLLRKLTGKAEFCSEAHREAYQEEFNSLALQRLASQPKQSRRPEPLPVPPASFSGLPFPEAGLPFPDEGEEFELPVFDSPIFTGLPAPVPEVAEASAPAPLWVFLTTPTPKVFGATPANYSFAVHLAGYPRDCMMTADRTWPAAALGFPEGGYAGLPEVQGSQTSPVPIDVAPWACLLTALSLPAASYPAAEASPRPAHFLSPAGLTGGAHESDAAPTSYAVPVPAREPSHLPALAHPYTRVPACGVRLAPPADAAELEPIPPVDSPTLAAPACDWPLALQVPLGSYFAPEATLPVAAAQRIHFGSPQRPVAPEAIGIETRPENLVTERRLTFPCFPAAAPLVAVAEAGLRLLWNFVPASNFAGDLQPGTLDTYTPVDRLWTVPAFSAQREPSIPVAELIPVPTTFSEVSFAAQSVRTDCLPWSAPALPNLSLAFAAAASSPAPFYSGYLLSAPVLLLAPILLNGEAPDKDWADWATFPPVPPAGSSLPVAPVGPCFSPVSAGLALLAAESVPDHPARHSESEPPEWLAASAPATSLRLAHHQTASTLAKVRVRDFAWPHFAAGCDSLFTPDQPFRFHEMPFPHRGTSDMIVGGAMGGDMMQGLRLTFSDDRFDFILRPGLTDPAIETWMSQDSQDPAVWPSRPAPVTPEAPRSASAVNEPPARKATEPPGSWQQAARAMHEGQQQVHRESAPAVPAAANPPLAEKPPAPDKPAAKPTSEAKPVNAVPVIAEPVKGNEVARFIPPQPPNPFVPHEPLNNRDRTQPPATDGPQFEWRRDQPHQAPPPPPPPGSSSVSINTTIVVEGGNGGSGIVVENAVRISLGDRGNKKKSDAVERFTEGDDLAAHPIQMAPPEPLPDFVAEPPELRAVLETIASLSDSIQWPKFSVTPMRRRIAFGPAKGGIFGGSPGHAASKASTETKTPLPPKKSVGGFLFKKLTNS